MAKRIINPRGQWGAYCKAEGCTGFADSRCPICKEPMCHGCAREVEQPSGSVILVCPKCFDAVVGLHLR